MLYQGKELNATEATNEKSKIYREKEVALNLNW
jgi:hypothetical protein